MTFADRSARQQNRVLRLTRQYPVLAASVKRIYWRTRVHFHYFRIKSKFYCSGSSVKIGASSVLLTLEDKP